MTVQLGEHRHLGLSDSCRSRLESSLSTWWVWMVSGLSVVDGRWFVLELVSIVRSYCLPKHSYIVLFFTLVLLQ
jgi:hypothetical protein